MKQSEKIIDVTFALLRAGLWNYEIRLSPFSTLDYSAMYQLAEEQSVVGLVAAGLEHVTDLKILKKDALPFMKKVFSLENRNASMNRFIEELVGRMRSMGIYALLVKGQGIGQCYERPQWRSSGDIDLFLDDDNYEKAKHYLLHLSTASHPESLYRKHLGITIESWTVELHGTLRCGLAFTIDKMMDTIQKDTFEKGHVRAWRNGDTDIFLPSPDNDSLIIFTHILKHFYKGGIGLRQICDWCRLLWTYRGNIDINLLTRRLRAMGLISEWKTFASYSVNYLSMPTEAMPLYDSNTKWQRKAKRIQKFILRVGNFGQNRDMSYYEKYPYFLRKTISLGRRIEDLWRHVFVFPWGTLRFFPNIILNGIRSAVRGE